jgi:hypothetical protein
MALRTFVLGFALAVLLSSGCCWHPWGRCCRYHEPEPPRVIIQPAPVVVQPIRTGP